MNHLHQDISASGTEGNPVVAAGAINVCIDYTGLLLTYKIVTE